MTKQRTPAEKFDNIPGELPKAQLPEGLKLNDVAQFAVLRLNNLQLDGLTDYAIWRDFIAFTGTYRTIYSASRVYDALTKLSSEKQRSVFRLGDGTPRRAASLSDSAWVDVDILFSVQTGRLVGQCAGTVSLVPCPDGKWRIWMLRTWLECFDGYGHPDVLQPRDHLSMTNGVRDGMVNGSTNGASHEETETEDYAAVIVGGGQAGLAVAGRLQALGVKYMILEKTEQIGDVWAKRYESFKWHTSKEYGNLPFGRTFPPEDDYMLPTKRIAAGHKAWSEKYGLNLRTSTTVQSADWDELAQKWTIRTSGLEGERVLTANDLVLAIGPGHATAVRPEWATPERIAASGFKGHITHAPSDYQTSLPWASKHGVVIGTANTAHDVAEDMANCGMHTTIVQRNPTYVFPAAWLHNAQGKTTLMA